MQKLKKVLSKFKYRGVLMAVITGVLGILVALGVIGPEAKETILDNAGMILTGLVAIGVIRAGADVKKAKKEKK
jgi:uncharacterized membrane protein